MTVPMPSPPADADRPVDAGADVDRTEELFLVAPSPTVASDAGAPSFAPSAPPAVRRRDWILTALVLLAATAGTVALLVSLWLQPGSGTVGG